MIIRLSKSSLLTFFSPSHVSIKDKFWEDGKTATPLKDWTLAFISQDQLDLCWENAKNIAVPILETKGKNFENDVIHPFLKPIVESIIQSLELNVTYRVRPSMKDPNLVPDATIFHSEIASGSWSDALVVFEYKVPHKVDKGIGQAISYLSQIIQKVSISDVPHR